MLTPRAVENISDQAIIAAIRDCRILFADDHEIHRTLISELLTQQGIHLVLAEDGQQAIQQFATQAFDMVLMDCHMPVMDGYQASRNIRAQANTAKLPILALTGTVGEKERERVFEAGMNDIVAKPVMPKQLFQLIYQWLPDNALASDTNDESTSPHQAASATDDHEQQSAFIHLNKQRVASFSGGNEATSLSILNAFMSTCVKDMMALKKSVNNDDKATLKDTCHRIKGAISCLGATELYEVAKKIENLADTMSAEDIQHQSGCLVSGYQQLIKEVRTWQGQLAT